MEVYHHIPMLLLEFPRNYQAEQAPQTCAERMLPTFYCIFTFISNNLKSTVQQISLSAKKNKTNPDACSGDSCICGSIPETCVLIRVMDFTSFLARPHAMSIIQDSIQTTSLHVFIHIITSKIGQIYFEPINVSAVTRDLKVDQQGSEFDQKGIPHKWWLRKAAKKTLMLHIVAWSCVWLLCRYLVSFLMVKTEICAFWWLCRSPVWPWLLYNKHGHQDVQLHIQEIMMRWWCCEWTNTMATDVVLRQK